MLQVLGKVTVTTGGTRVRATNNQPVPSDRFACHAILIQALSTNTGKIYIGTSVLDRTTLAGVHAVLAVPTANNFPTFSAALTLAPAAIHAQDIWIDADNNGEGVLVTTLIT